MTENVTVEDLCTLSPIVNGADTKADLLMLPPPFLLSCNDHTHNHSQNNSVFDVVPQVQLLQPLGEQAHQIQTHLGTHSSH